MIDRECRVPSKSFQVCRKSTGKVYDCPMRRSANSRAQQARIFDGCSGCVKRPSLEFSMQRREFRTGLADK